MAHRKRYFLYSQHMAGTGHFVRTCEIAKALDESSEIYLVDGGRPVPRELPSGRCRLITLPRIRREGQRVVPMDPNAWLADVMAERSRILRDAIERICPDVLMVEHFPFRRWEVYAEIVPIIRHARTVSQCTRVICSLRDIPGRSCFEPCIDRYSSDVLSTLHEHFDQVLVHADPGFIRLDEQLAWVDQIQVPVEYTGYVSQGVPAPAHATNEAARAGVFGKTVLVSTGGTGNTAMLMCAIEAWNLLATKGAVDDLTMVIFTSLSTDAEDQRALEHRAAGSRIRVLPYSKDFLNWMQNAELSISKSGYNTCTNLLETRTRAILIPSLHLSDEPLRAERFAQRGLACAMKEADLNPQRLAEAIVARLQSAPPRHDVNLAGAETTRAILEMLLGSIKIHHFRVPGPAPNESSSPRQRRA